ncbi:Ribonuclease H superfamily protein [Abortiporus biennis]
MPPKGSVYRRPATVLTPRKQRRILREVKKHPESSYNYIANQFDDVTARQVRAACAKADYHHQHVRTRGGKPYLNQISISKRIVWAKQNARTNWGKVIWCDELKLELQEKSGRHKRSGLTGEEYASQVLEGPLKQFYDELTSERGDGIQVVEDGLPSHSSRVAKDTRARLNIRTLPLPPHSPDLNRIKPLWVVLKDHIGDIPGSHSSVDNLWDAARHVWDQFTWEEIEHIVGSMKERVEAVREAKGRYTRF